MNVKLLRRVKKHILEEPRRLCMAWYVIKKSEDKKLIAGRPFAKCNTAACIAGWTLELNKIEVNPYACIAGWTLELNKIEVNPYESEHIRACKLLDISYDEGLRLFEPSSWPLKFRDGRRDDGTEETAQVAAARIEHFIKTKGRE
jgi:hypothetical protein